MHAADPPADRPSGTAAPPGEVGPLRRRRRLVTLMRSAREHRDRGSDDLVLSLMLPGGGHAPARAGAALAALSRDLEHEQLGLLRLLVGELVSNSVIHGETGPSDELRVRITVDRDSVRCDVRDSGPGFAVPDQLEPRDTGGLGLVIVDRASERWGTRDGGRHVWFELVREHPPSRSRRR